MSPTPRSFGAGYTPRRYLSSAYVAWMVLAFPIGWTISQLTFGPIFYGLFTPIALVFRLVGPDPLHRFRQQALEAYWTLKATPTDPRRYFKQFESSERMMYHGFSWTLTAVVTAHRRLLKFRTNHEPSLTQANQRIRDAVAEDRRRSQRGDTGVTHVHA